MSKMTPNLPLSNLLFLTNELQSPFLYKQMKLPLEFIAFGITEGKMYKHFRNQSTFVAPVDIRGKNGNIVVYGGLFHCSDVNFYLRIFDAYHVCSLNTLHKNHINDLHHRIITNITPIYFNTLDELARLKYREGETLPAHTYIGNIKHPNIKRRIFTVPFTSYRIKDGIVARCFKSLYEEVKIIERG